MPREDVLEDELCRLVGEGRHTDEELVEADAKAPPVHGVRVRVVEEQLRRKVVRGAQDPASWGTIQQENAGSLAGQDF